MSHLGPTLTSMTRLSQLTEFCDKLASNLAGCQEITVLSVVCEIRLRAVGNSFNWNQ